MTTAVINLSIRDFPWKACLLATGILGTVSLFILASIYPTFPGDEEAIIRFQALRTGWLDDIAVGFAWLGLVQVFLPIVAAMAAGLLLVRRYADVAMIVVGLAVLGVGSILKELVDRPRPEFQILGPDPSGLSFPSGHTLLAFIIGGILVHLVGHNVKPLLLRRVIQAGLILAVIIMGASRVYLGVHWPSDVIGSYAFGAMAIVGVIGIRNMVSSAR